MSSLQNLHNALMQIFSIIKFNYEWIKNTSADRICWVFQKWSFQGGQTFQIQHFHWTKQPMECFSPWKYLLRTSTAHRLQPTIGLHKACKQATNP